MLLLAVNKGLKRHCVSSLLKAQRHTREASKIAKSKIRIKQKNKQNSIPHNFKYWKYAESKEKALSSWTLLSSDNPISYSFKSYNFSHEEK